MYSTADGRVYWQRVLHTIASVVRLVPSIIVIENDPRPGAVMLCGLEQHPPSAVPNILDTRTHTRKTGGSKWCGQMLLIPGAFMKLDFNCAQPFFSSATTTN